MKVVSMVATSQWIPTELEMDESLGWLKAERMAVRILMVPGWEEKMAEH